MRTLVLWAALVGCGESTTRGDAGEDRDGARRIDGGFDSGRACAGRCDDGVFCNGVAICDPWSPEADARGCVAAVPPCGEGTICDEMSESCVSRCDADRDGRDSTDCGGDDCDDTRASVRPGAPEICNAIDDDCDGEVDEGVATTFYQDADGDGFGAMDSARTACAAPVGYSENAGDCDDSDPGVHPGASEVCDAAGVDENCDGVVNPSEICPCIRGTARPCTLPGRCAAGVETCIDFTWSACSIGPTVETCDGEDDDCDGSVDEGVTVDCYTDTDSDTFPAAGAAAGARCPVPSRPSVGGCPIATTNRSPLMGTDCNDANAAVYPGAMEICVVPFDEDCDTVVDEGC